MVIHIYLPGQMHWCRCTGGLNLYRFSKSKETNYIIYHQSQTKSGIEQLTVLLISLWLLCVQIYTDNQLEPQWVTGLSEI